MFLAIYLLLQYPSTKNGGNAFTDVNKHSLSYNLSSQYFHRHVTTSIQHIRWRISSFINSFAGHISSLCTLSSMPCSIPCFLFRRLLHNKHCTIASIYTIFPLPTPCLVLAFFSLFIIIFFPIPALSGCTICANGGVRAVHLLSITLKI